MKGDGQAVVRRPKHTFSIWSDIQAFFLHRPKVSTRVDLSDPVFRKEYSDRIMQRVGIDATEYAVLNIHGIGINAPIPTIA